DREHHDAGEDAVVIGRQGELQGEEQRDHGGVERHDTTRRGPSGGPRAPASRLYRRRDRLRLAAHRVAVPNRPVGRNTSTSATSSVAIILASVGWKKAETMPSERPISTAATSVPRNEPSPPMMTTMKDNSSGS